MNTLACPVHRFWSPPDNPYCPEFTLALFALFGVFVLWRHLRPPPRLLLRVYAGVGAAVAVFVMCAVLCGAVTPRSAEYEYLVVVRACWLVGASLLAEILLSLRPRHLPRVVVRLRR